MERSALQNSLHSCSRSCVYQWAGGLKLFAAGSQGVPELKKHITDDNIYFAFCRELAAGTYYFVTIAYIPEGVSGLRRSELLSLPLLRCPDSPYQPELFPPLGLFSLGLRCAL